MAKFDPGHYRQRPWDRPISNERWERIFNKQGMNDTGSKPNGAKKRNDKRDVASGDV